MLQAGTKTTTASRVFNMAACDGPVQFHRVLNRVFDDSSSNTAMTTCNSTSFSGGGNTAIPASNRTTFGGGGKEDRESQRLTELCITAGGGGDIADETGTYGRVEPRKTTV